MFKKLIANLPFNPGLIDQVNFYAKRLKRESVVRRFGFLALGLALMVQVIAGLYPAQNSLAASPNDILDGITSKQSVLNAWDANTGNVRGIYSKFGVTRAELDSMGSITITSDASKNYWSIGRQKLSAFGINGATWGERAIDANGTTVYQRPLHAWDKGGVSSYPAFEGRNSSGKVFWILKTCGNITFVGAYLPPAPTPAPKPTPTPAPAPKPSLNIHKYNNLSKSSYLNGDRVQYNISFGNTVAGTTATNFQLSDTLDPNLDFVSTTGGTYNSSTHTLGFPNTPTLSAAQTVHSFVVTATINVKGSPTYPFNICNRAYISSAQTGKSGSETVCVKVVKPGAMCTVPGKTNLPANSDQCFTPCKYNSSIPDTSPSCVPPVTPPTAGGTCTASTAFVSGSSRDFIIRTQLNLSSGTKATAYNYDIDNNGSIDMTDKTSDNPHSKTLTGFSNGKHTVAVTANLSNGTQTSKTAVCTAQITIAENPNVEMSKTVSNITQGLSSANGSTVNPGDVLEFKLSTKNITSVDYQNFVGEDDFSSVLQYADFADSSELTSQGITVDSQSHLHWSAATIKVGSSDVKTIRVKVKDPIPTTNSPSTVSPDFNCKIANEYGNQIVMNVNCPVVKTVSIATTSLPNTGPGTSIAIGAIITVVAGYLFARSRLLAKELSIVKQDYIVGGSV